MVTAVIVAAGSSTRMGSGVDKLFLEIMGRPLVAYTWRRFDGCPEIAHVILVIRESAKPAFLQMASELGLKKSFSFAIGGAARQDSVWNGLQAAPEGTDIVAIQDAARPCTPSGVIEATIRAAREIGAAVAAQRVTDTIKESDDASTISRNIDRSKLWAVQTPQTFRIEVIRRALEAVRKSGLSITDDTAACELIGQPVKLVETGVPNPKATSPGDLPLLETLLRLEISAARSAAGTG